MSTTVEMLMKEHGCTKDQAMLANSEINKTAKKNRMEASIAAGEITINKETGKKQLVVEKSPFKIITGGDSNMLYGEIPESMDAEKFKASVVREIYEAAKFHGLGFCGFASLLIFVGISVYESIPNDLRQYVTLDTGVGNTKFIVKRKS